MKNREKQRENRRKKYREEAIERHNKCGVKAIKHRLFFGSDLTYSQRKEEQAMGNVTGGDSS